MIYSEDPIYGWGIGGIPMPRENSGPDRPLPRRNPGSDFVGFARDFPWRALTASFLLTLGGIFILLTLERHLPPLLGRPDTAPVKISVRFREKAPEPPPAQAAVPREEPVPAPRVERPRPHAPAKPAPPEKRMAPPPPPATAARAVQEPKKEEALPAVLPPPSSATYQRAPRPAVEPPLAADRQLRPEGEGAALLLPAPDLRPGTERSAREELPAAESVAMGGRAALDLAVVDAGAPRQRYQERSRGAAMPEPTQGESLQRAQPHEGKMEAVPSLDTKRFQARANSDLPLPARRPQVPVAGPASPAVNLPLPAGTARTAPEPERNLPEGSTASFAFLDRVAAADLDRMHLVTLNRLRTCLDPQEEMRLRTRLATLLSRPGTCRTGGVVFDVSQPESAWSIHVDIYNYEKRDFQDRCAALRLAVDCCQARR